MMKHLVSLVTPAACMLVLHATTAMAAPQLKTQFEVRDGYITLDRSNTTLDMGADRGGPHFRDCPKLTADQIKAQAIQLIEQQLRARGTVLQRFALGEPPSGAAAKQRFEQARQALERDIAADKVTAELNGRMHANWTEMSEALGEWLERKQAVKPEQFVGEPNFADTFIATLDNTPWIDGPARVPTAFRDKLLGDFMAVQTGQVTFEITPPFRKVLTQPNGALVSALQPTSGRLDRDIEDMADAILAPLDCQLWSRPKIVGRTTELLGGRGVAATEFHELREGEIAAPGEKFTPPPLYAAGIDPRRTDAIPEVGSGIVWFSPVPRANRLFVLVDPSKDNSLLKRILYLTVPSGDWAVLKALPPERLCILDSLKRASGFKAVRLSFITSPDLAFSNIRLTRRVLGELEQRLADLDYGTNLILGVTEGDIGQEVKYASIVVEPKVGTQPEGKNMILKLPACTAEVGGAGAAEAEAESLSASVPPALAPQAKVAPAQRTKEQPKHEIRVGASVGGGLAPKLWADFTMPGLKADDSVAVGVSHQTQPSSDVTYSRDFVGFDNLFSRRVQLSLRGFSLVDPAPPASTGQGELRRKGFEGRATFDLFRDWRGMFAQADLSAERHGVRDMAGVVVFPDITKVSVGFNAARSIHATGRSPHTELGGSFSRGRAERGGMFTLVKADIAHQQFVGAFARWDLRVNTSIASSTTPASESPKFGGEDSVRGYAADSSLARRTWTVQNEYWFLPPGVENSESGFAATLRKTAAMAVFVDLGELQGAPLRAEGRKLGVGVGVRLVFNDFVTLRLDQAHPVKERDPAFDRKGKWYLTVTTRRQL